jgi:hypothetical protein
MFARLAHESETELRTGPGRPDGRRGAKKNYKN